MPRILIAGCGYVGEAAAGLFHERGWEVEGWTASAESAARLAARPYPVRAVDISDAVNIPPVCQKMDVIVQCASTRGGTAEEYRRVYLEGARTLLRLFPSAKYVFTSSTSVYAQRDCGVVDELSPANPTHERGCVLRAAEELVLAHQGIVARVGGIYGPGRSFLLQSLLDGKAVSYQGNDHFLNQVHRDDIVSALWFLVERRADLGGQIYNVVDGQPILESAAVQWLSERLHRLPSAERVTREGKRGTTNKRVSNRKLHGLGWELRYPNFQAGMSESVLPSFIGP